MLSEVVDVVFTLHCHGELELVIGLS
jgi:hypothetical protein